LNNIDLDQLIIRPEQPEDAGPIRHIHEKAFGTDDEAILVDAIRNRGAITLSLVAALNSSILGHILFSPVTIVTNSSHLSICGLGPIGVLPENQRQGIGSKLINGGLEKCRTQGMKGVVVLGQPEYYTRFHFLAASRFGIGCEYNVPDGVFMIQELDEGALSNYSGGIAKYQPEFNVF
jgi:putative acetyltransferase